MELKKLLEEMARAIAKDRRSGQEVEVSFLEKFENQRRDIGRIGFGVSNEIVKLSKFAIAALKTGDKVRSAECLNEIRRQWEQLGTADLPEDVAWQFDSEAGSEMVEAFMVASLYPLICSEENDVADKIESHEDLQVKPAAWLAGIGDSISELGKLHIDLLLNPELGFKERIVLRQRYLKVANEMYAFLDQFETCYGMVIDHTRRRGFGNTFRGMLFRISLLIQRENEDLARALDFQAALRDLQAK